MVGRLLHMGWLGGSTRSTTGRQAPGAVGTRMVVRAGRPLPYLPADGDVGAGGGGHWLKEGPNAAAVRHGGSSGAGGFCKCSRSMYDNIEVACAYRLLANSCQPGNEANVPNSQYYGRILLVVVLPALAEHGRLHVYRTAINQR